MRLDVTNEQERQAAVQAAIERFDRIDVVVNNAGRGSLGAAEEFSSAQLRELMDINFFACAAMIRPVLPHMRQQKSGHILNISSIGGRVNVGGFAVYGAAKLALEGYSEALQDEVKPLGIRVTVIEPIRQYLYGGSGKQPGDPRRAAEAMIQVVESEDLPLHLMLGADAYGLWEQKRTAMDAEIAR